MYALANSQLIHPYPKKIKIQLISTSHPFANKKIKLHIKFMFNIGKTQKNCPFKVYIP
jgi:hypothetical protein